MVSRLAIIQNRDYQINNNRVIIDMSFFKATEFTTMKSKELIDALGTHLLVGDSLS